MFVILALFSIKKQNLRKERPVIEHVMNCLLNSISQDGVTGSFTLLLTSCSKDFPDYGS